MRQTRKKNRAPAVAEEGLVHGAQDQRPGFAAAMEEVLEGCQRPLDGQGHVFVRTQRQRVDFAVAVKTLGDALHPRAGKVVLVMDQLNTHGVARLCARGVPARRDPSSGRTAEDPPHAQAWRLALNVAGIENPASWPASAWRSASTTRRVWKVKEKLLWRHARHQTACKVDGRFATAAARVKLKRLYPVVLP